MAKRVLLTGVSGYLGGTLLVRLDLTDCDIYALVRSSDQAERVRPHRVTPLVLDVSDVGKVKEAIIEKEITIVFFLIDAVHSATQVAMMEALAEVRARSGKAVHFLHTSGAKIFSSHAGFPNRVVYDTDQVYELQQTCTSHLDMVKQAMATNNTVIDTAERLGVRSYIFVPCIVYGEGEGFGNRISIQTAAIVRVAKAVGQVYRPHSGKPAWPVCHILDNTELYLQMLRKMVQDEDIGYGKNGYYLAASGHVVWEDLYTAIAKRLVEKKVVTTSAVEDADSATLEKMAKTLESPTEYVALQLGGECKFAAAHGHEIGWQPNFKPEHVIDSAAHEVDLILETLESSSS